MNSAISIIVYLFWTLVAISAILLIGIIIGMIRDLL